MVELISKKDEKSISMAMSQLLRHGAEAKDLKIDAGGWVLLSEMLEIKEFKKKNVDLQKIQYIVANSEKKRFELSEDLRKVRACQGHSITKVKSEELL